MLQYFKRRTQKMSKEVKVTENQEEKKVPLTDSETNEYLNKKMAERLEGTTMVIDGKTVRVIPVPSNDDDDDDTDGKKVGFFKRIGNGCKKVKNKVCSAVKNTFKDKDAIYRIIGKIVCKGIEYTLVIVGTTLVLKSRDGKKEIKVGEIEEIETTFTDTDEETSYEASYEE